MNKKQFEKKWDTEVKLLNNWSEYISKSNYIVWVSYKWVTLEEMKLWENKTTQEIEFINDFESIV